MVSSVVSNSTNSLYMCPLALRWLQARHIALCWLPALNIALVWLPTTRFFNTRAPNIVTRLEVELQPIHRLPALAPSPTYSHTLAPYTDSLHPVLPQGVPIKICARLNTSHWLRAFGCARLNTSHWLRAFGCASLAVRKRSRAILVARY